MTKQQILSLIDSDITTNGLGSITGAVLNNVLKSIADEMVDYTEVDLTSPQILSLASTPVQILATAGTGSYYDIEKVAIQYDAGTASYAVNGSEFISMMSSGSSAVFSCPDTLITESVDSIALRSQSDVGDYNYVSESYNLSMLTSTQSVGTDPTTGNGTLKVKVWYYNRTFA